MIKKYHNSAAIETLPSVNVKASLTNIKHDNNERVIDVHVSNPTNHLAFLIELKLVKSYSNQLVRPSFYNDNFFSLLPSEKKIIRIECFDADINGEDIRLIIDGWNVKTKEISVE